MRILIVVPSYDTYAAVSIRMRYFINALKKRFHEDVQVYRFNLGSKVQRLAMYVLNRISQDLIDAVNQSEIVLTTTPPPLLPIALNKAKTRYVVDVRDIWEAYAEAYYPKIITNVIVRKYYNALQDAEKLIVTTKGMKRYYEERLNVEATIIPNGSDPQIIKCHEDIEREDKIVFLADFNTPYQNLEPLLEVLKHTNINLEIIGDGKYLKKYLKYAERLGVLKKIRLIGRVPYDKLSKYLCRAKIGAVGRPFEHNPEYLLTIPTKVYDYMAAGLAILAWGPPNSELEELVTKNGLGYFVSKNDTDTLREYLENLLEEYKYMGKAGRALVTRFYDRNKLSSYVVKILTLITS